MASRETDKPLLLSTLLRSKDEVAMMRLFSTDTDSYLDIEVEVIDVVEDLKRSHYFVSLYVANNKVTESTKSESRSLVVKWEWKANNQM